MSLPTAGYPEPSTGLSSPSNESHNVLTQAKFVSATQDRAQESEALSSHPDKEDSPRDVCIGTSHVYRVPQLKEPPRGRSRLSETINSLNRDNKNTSGERRFPGGVQMHITSSRTSADLCVSGSVSSNTQTSSFFSSIRDSPITPWDHADPSTKSQQASVGALRPTTESYVPPSARSVTNYSNKWNMPESAGIACGLSTNAPNAFTHSDASAAFDVRSALSIVSAATRMRPADRVPPLSLAWETPPLAFTSQHGNESHSPFTSLVKQGVATSSGRANNNDRVEDVSSSAVSSQAFSESGTIAMTSSSDATTSSPGANVIECEPTSFSAIAGTGNSGLADEPEIWEERRQLYSFKTQCLNEATFEEVFKGAFNVLATLNPDHYRMPWGSCVVCIKTSSVTNILLSLKNGIWACPEPVADRIRKVWGTRKSEEEQVLMLFSVPGSKQFCGLAELKEYHAEEITDFWEHGTVYQGTMILSWVFCKLVPYDDIRRRVESVSKTESATQMWNGMHYSEPMGRAVIEAYVRYPHVENLLAKPRNKIQDQKRSQALQGSSIGPRGKNSGQRGAHKQHVTKNNQSIGQQRGGRNGFGQPKAGDQQHWASPVDAKDFVPPAQRGPRSSKAPSGVGSSGLSHYEDVFTSAEPQSSPAFGRGFLGFAEVEEDCLRTAPIPATLAASPTNGSFSNMKYDVFESSGSGELDRAYVFPPKLPIDTVNSRTPQRGHVGIADSHVVDGKNVEKDLNDLRDYTVLAPKFQTPNAQTHLRPSNVSSAAVSTPRPQRPGLQMSVGVDDDLRGYQVGVQNNAQLGAWQIVTPTRHTFLPTTTPLNYTQFSSFVTPGDRPWIPDLAKHDTLSPTVGEGRPTGHGMRKSGFRSSVDMRMDNMVDNLVGSPSRKNKTSGNDSANTSDM